MTTEESTIHIPFPFGISEYGQIPRFDARGPYVLEEEDQVPQDVLYILQDDGILFYGMAELIQHLVDQRPRTRSARDTCEKSLSFVVPANDNDTAICIPWVAVHEMTIYDMEIVVRFTKASIKRYTPSIYRNPRCATMIIVNGTVLVQEELLEEIEFEDDDDLLDLPADDMPDIFEGAMVDLFEQHDDDLDTAVQAIRALNDTIVDAVARADPTEQLLTMLQQSLESTTSVGGGKKCSICLEKEDDLRKDNISLVVAECETDGHEVCTECLKRYATNSSNHPVSVNVPYVSCPAEGCIAPVKDTDLFGVLTDAERDRLNERISDCQQRAYPTVVCPIAGCGKSIQINGTALQDRAVGTLPIVCGDHAFCFHCLGPIAPRDMARYHRAQERQHPTLVAVCSCSVDRRPRLGNFNRFLTRNRPRKAGEFALLRNFELTPDECARQIEAFCTGDTMPVQCMACLTPLARSEACNEISHCGQVRCWVCGEAGLDFDTRLIDHWDGHGIQGCPRWSNDPFWSNTVHARERCREGQCCGGDRDCTVAAHAGFRKEVVGVRRLRRLQRTILSMPQPLRDATVRKIRDRNGKAKEWLDQLHLACEHHVLI